MFVTIADQLTRRNRKDVIHEFLGHVPLLTNRKFADFAQRLGLVSLGASNDFVNKLTTLFWFTIEFGLCLEVDQLRAVGAGILSSFGELEHAFSDESEKRPLEPSTTAIQPYDDVGYQPVYFVCQSFELMEQQLNEYVRTVQKDVWATYDPYTETMKLRSSTELREAVIENVAKQIEALKFNNLA
ncbi:tyrosine 3-monooxygenase [Paragonimus westermani]|uniref:Tyrosine 3-monooxygenase n=1 Tax=Paragonimus westermani TaxID=34504 RepID=A0A5J4NT96_9TREM|nr:tyrosine 3-monooxygenase [Paragonimus westermani]